METVIYSTLKQFNKRVKTYASTGTAMVTSEESGEITGADHTHGHLVIFYPQWCHLSQSLVMLFFFLHKIIQYFNWGNYSCLDSMFMVS